MNNNSLCIIPCSMDSKRLPGKPMLSDHGEPLFYTAYKQAKEYFNIVIIATDAQEVGNRCNDLDIPWVNTGKHTTGTSRCIEAYATLVKLNPKEWEEQFHFLVNWQVDYPEVTYYANTGTIEYIQSFSYLETDLCQIDDQDNVKVIINNLSEGVYFSRAIIPYKAESANIHIGIYTIPVQFISRLKEVYYGLSPEIVSKENLEQLDWLKNAGTFWPDRSALFMINSPKTDAINTELDYINFCRRFKKDDTNCNAN